MSPFRPALALAALAALAGCGPTIPPARTSLPAAKVVAADTGAADAAETAADLYSYDPKGKRDPFQNTVKSATGMHAVVDPSLLKRPRQALQNFDIDQLQLQLAVTGTSSPSALIIDPTGKAHLVHIGDFVGRNWGKVSHIGPEGLTITETIADQQTGRVSPEYIPLLMKKSDQEKAAEQALKSAGAGGSP